MIARVTTETPTNSNTQAGIMLRGTNDPGSPNVFLAITPYNGLTLTSRSANNANTFNEGAFSASTSVWLKLIRSGTGTTNQVINAYESPDRQSWSLVGAQSIGFVTTIEAGVHAEMVQAAAKRELSHTSRL